jgi:hypothetical protein
MNAGPRYESISGPRSLARGAGVVLMSATLFPSSATAQSRFEFTPSLSLVQAYDDNLFARPSDKEEDFISRLSVRVGVGHRSHRLRLRARYALDAEAYRDHRELDTATAYQEGGLDLSWMPSRRTTAAATAAYAEAQTAGQLNTITGFEVGRLPARRLSSTASLSRRLGTLTTATVTHSFNQEQVVDGPVSETQAVTLWIKQRMGPVAQGRVTYSAQRFEFGPEATVSQVVTLGWSREITPFAHFELEAGPRFAGHTVAAEVSAGFNHRFRRGTAALALLRTLTTVVGQPGPVTAEGVTATFSRGLLRSFRVGCVPAIFRLRGVGSETTVRRLSVDVGWRMTRQLSLAASHLFTFQRGGLNFGQDPDAEMTHNTFSVSVVAGAGAN